MSIKSEDNRCPLAGPAQPYNSLSLPETSSHIRLLTITSSRQRQQLVEYRLEPPDFSKAPLYDALSPILRKLRDNRAYPRPRTFIPKQVGLFERTIA